MDNPATTNLRCTPPSGLERLKCPDDQSQLISKSKRRSNNVRRIDCNDISSPLDSSSLLGKGGFASVYQVQIDKKIYALKCLRSIQTKTKNPSVIGAESLAWEVNFLSKLNHENIIALRGVSSSCLSEESYSSRSSERNSNSIGYFFIMDVLEETLFDRLERWHDEEMKDLKALTVLRRSKRKLNNMFQRLSSTVFGIVNGMAYLHKYKIVFGDLKPENIGFDSTTGQVKLFDFGLARISNVESAFFSNNEEERKMCNNFPGGSLPYMAPEALQGLDSCDLPSDVYSFGILLWEICALQQHLITCPAKYNDGKEYIHKVVRKGVRPSVSAIPCKAIRRLLQDCWDPRPDRRPSFSRIWCLLTDIIGKKVDSRCSYKVNQPIEAKLLISSFGICKPKKLPQGRHNSHAQRGHSWCGETVATSISYGSGNDSFR